MVKIASYSVDRSVVGRWQVFDEELKWGEPAKSAPKQNFTAVV
jgi:hypothetical protein